MGNFKGYNKEEVSSLKRKKALIKACLLLSCGIGLIVVACSLGTKSNNSVKASDNISSIVDFDNISSEYSYTYDKIKIDFFNVNFVKGNDRLFVKEDALWVKYPALSSGIENSGAMINSKLEPSKQYTLEYEVYFDGSGNKFDYQDGGALCGLAGGEFYDGNTTKVGKEGFHVMLTYNNYGYLYPVIYQANDAKVGGDVYADIGQIKEYAWNKIKMYVRVNDKGQNNGVVRIWHNDKLCFNNEKLRMATSELFIDTNNLCAYNNETSKVLDHEQFVYIDSYRIFNSIGINNK
ncbi:MAG: hypothetical protein E7262_07860 [Lachnospiraceae bacterium]|nr:hypothetical protein [Lachnospiraceae bacterium]